MKDVRARFGKMYYLYLFVMKDLRGWQDYPESAHGAAGHGYSHSRWVERCFTDLYGSNADEQLEQTSSRNLIYGFFNVFFGRRTSANPFENSSRSESTNRQVLSIAFANISKNQPFMAAGKAFGILC